MNPDPKAKNILFRTYWSSIGWKEESTTKPAAFEYAKSMGLMFDRMTIAHDEIVAQTIQLRDQISLKNLCQAFLCSLSSRNLSIRSAIASYHNCLNMEQHSFEPREDMDYLCQTCGQQEIEADQDLNVLNFERHKWGGVRHSDLLYNLFDLREFSKLEIAQPKKEDIELFKAILETAAKSESDDFPSTLEERLKSVIKSNQSERQQLMEILACIGVFQAADLNRPIRGKNDWVYIEMWRGSDQYNKARVNELFGSFL